MVMTVQNGLPWWYFQKLGGEYEGHRLRSLDPNGLLTEKIASERILGCVVYPAASVPRPGVIAHVEGDRFPLGELDGSISERAQRMHDVLVHAGLKSRVLKDIRSEICSRLGAICPSTPSAPSPTPRWPKSASSPRPGNSPPP
jgi:ketopantoate reductase